MSDSEGSNMASPQSVLESPYSSPSQQVPQLAYSMTELRCTDKYMHPEKGKCFLRIVEQPQDHFRFRYRSEMVGTHGCLLGESYGSSKNKTHPTVELVNYSGRAIIRCRLAQEKTPEEHPHKLLEEEQDRDVSYEVPEHGCYKVGFAGMGIIHTAKKDVPGLLYKKYSEKLRSNHMNTKDLRAHCENEAKGINLNIVRLRFSAHDLRTDEEICPPVFSKPIHNMKSAATNDLKISRISRSCGRASGGEDVFLLVEKVNKKNIMIRFFELDEDKREIWQATGHFLQSDVHHQYAIVFRTPPYRDPNTSVDKKVFIELVRPSDGRTSEPKEFKYKASPSFKGLGKRKKTSSPYSSICSSSDGSLRSNGDVPATVLYMKVNPHSNDQPDSPIEDVQMCTIPQIPVIPQAAPSSTSDLGEAILYGMGAETTHNDMYYPSPMLPQPASDPPELQLNSAEFQRLLKDNLSIPANEAEQMARLDWSEYMRSLPDSLLSLPGENNPTNSMEFMRAMLVPDSGRVTKPEKQQKVVPKEVKTVNSVDKTAPSEYTAFYKCEDGAEVKKLVKELCDIIRDKTGVKKQIVRAKLERLLEMRLSNGDTFLHMTLCSKQPSLDYIVKLIHNMKMTHLLNLTNNLSQTIFHLAVVHDMPKIVAFLASKGCNPMSEDVDGNNVVHYTVLYQACMTPLLQALKDNTVSYDLNAYNNDKHTALHLAVILKSESSARILLQNGASYNARDSDGRTPLHLAAYDDCLPVLAALLEHVLSSEIDATDGRGYTALQIVCDGKVRENTLTMVKLLLEKQADPLKSEGNTSPAWVLARDKPGVRGVMRAQRPALALHTEDEVKSEPPSDAEDDYESADESLCVVSYSDKHEPLPLSRKPRVVEELEDDARVRETGLAELGMYVEEVSAELDGVGGWSALARLLRLAHLHSWYAHTPSPTRTLLNHVKECGDDLSSKELAMALDSIGQTKAANIIRKYIN